MLLNILFYTFIKRTALFKKRYKIFIIIKDFLRINIKLYNNVSYKAMKTANLFQNHLFTKTKSYEKFVREKNQSNKRQNMSHIKIFKNKILVNIL